MAYQQFNAKNEHHFSYKGASVEVRRHRGPHAWDWDWQYFISINGDFYPYGVPYRYFSSAVKDAKRRIDKGDFESSDIFLATGIHTLDDPSIEGKACYDPVLAEKINAWRQANGKA